MTISKNVSGTWTPAKHIWKNIAGVWTKVHRVYKNVAGTWTVYHRDDDFVVNSYGLEQNVMTTKGTNGLSINTVFTATPAARSYNLVLFDSTGAQTFYGTYDVFGDSTNYAAAGSATNTFIAKLQSIPVGTPYVIFTYDEPQTNCGQLTSYLTALFGGTASILSVANIAYRGAYTAIGIAGQAPCVETTCGTFMNSVSNPSATTSASDDGCLDAYLSYKFNVHGGKIVNLSAVQLGGNLKTNPTLTATTTF